MSEDYSPDLYKAPSSYDSRIYRAPDLTSNISAHSIINNVSDQGRLNQNMLSQNYEDKIQNRVHFDKLTDLEANADGGINSQQKQKKQFSRDSFEIMFDSLDSFKSSINYFMDRICNYDAIYIAKTFKKILSCQFNTSSANYFAFILATLKRLSLLIKNSMNPLLFTHTINVVLEKTQKIYKCSISNIQTIPIIQIYLQIQQITQQIFENIQTLLSQHFQYIHFDETQYQFTSDFFDFIYQFYCNDCLKQNQKQLNLLIYSKGTINKKQQLFENKKHYILKQNIIKNDKKQIQDYLKLLFEIVNCNFQFLKTHFLSIIQQFIKDKSLEKKILGLKYIGDIIKDKITQNYKQQICIWINQINLLSNYLVVSINVQLFQHISPILVFLYQNNQIEKTYLQQLLRNSIQQQDIFTMTQLLIKSLKKQHLAITLRVLNNTKKKQQIMLNYFNSLIANKYLQRPKQQRNINVQIINQQQCALYQNNYPQQIKEFINTFTNILIVVAKQNLNQYVPLLLKFISNHISLNEMKTDIIASTIQLLKAHDPLSIWIMEHLLRTQSNKIKAERTNEIISKLALQGAFEFTLIMIAKNRFNKIIVQKAISVIIIFCRFNKPLQKVYIQFLWRVLGLTARDQKQRQQIFYNFLKDLLRYQNSIKQDSVNFIFFQVLLSLSADWFSIRVYQCLEMLFLRLNQDCKLLQFDNNYRVKDEKLIGIQKFWYIYFNCLDLKVVKKCKDLFYRLTVNSQQKRSQMYISYIQNITRYAKIALDNQQISQNKKQVIIIRIFDIIQKFCKQKQTKQEENSTIKLKIDAHMIPNNLASSNYQIRTKDSVTLFQIRMKIANNLDPYNDNFQIWHKGKVLKTQNLTLRQLKLQNNSTLHICLRQQQKNIENKQKISQQCKKLCQIFSISFQQSQYILDKYKGQIIQNIINQLSVQNRLENLKDQFKNKKMQQQQIEQIGQITILKFSQMLIKKKQDLYLLLNCSQQSNNHIKYWQFLRRLPLNKEIKDQVNIKYDKRQWKQIFVNKSSSQQIYNLHVLKMLVKKQQNKNNIYYQNQLFYFLLQFLEQLINKDTFSIILLQDINDLILQGINSQLFVKLDKNDYSTVVFSQIPQIINPINYQQKIKINRSLIQKLFNLLLSKKLSGIVVKNIAKLYLCTLKQVQYYSILQNTQIHQKLLIKYGKPIQYITIFTAERQNKSLQVAFSLLQYANKSFTFNDESHYSSFFSCIQRLLILENIPIDTQRQIKYLETQLIKIKCQISSFKEQQIFGHFKIIKCLIDRIDIYNFQQEQRIYYQQLFKTFSLWLLQQYLFGYHNNYPYYKNKNVRKAGYQLILVSCKFGSIFQSLPQFIQNFMAQFKKGIKKPQFQFRDNQYIGLKNIGNSCYINSCLQQLFHTVFPKYLLQIPQGMKELKKTFAQLHLSVKNLINPEKYVSTININGQNIVLKRQQDVHQYFCSLMHDIQKSKCQQAIQKVFRGNYRDKICGSQQNISIKYHDQQFYSHNLDIIGKKNLYQALNSHSKPTKLEGENMYFSQQLNKKINAYKSTTFLHLPNILAITLKRFSWDYGLQARKKSNDYFEFPLQLQMTQYTTDHKEQKFTLCGIIIHLGSANSGHYYSYIKTDKGWYEFNDSSVTEWDINTNLKNDCFGGGDDRSKSAYMLFYQKVGENSHGNSLHLLPSTNNFIRQVINDNRQFTISKLIYDSNYIDFVKSLSKITNNPSVQLTLSYLIDYRPNQNKQEMRNIQQCLYNNAPSVVPSDLQQLVQKINKKDTL